jgi:CBS domain containing-hemolysin-like protein
MNKEDSESESTQEKKSVIKKFFEILRFYRGPDTKEELESEIQELLEEGEEQGLITSLEEKMISSIFDFRETLAAEIMTPAIEISSVDVSTPVPELVEYVVDSGYTRTPVYKGNNDRIVGVVHVKDLLKASAAKNGEYPLIEDFANPVYFVSEQKPILDLLREFQKRKIHIAVVTDEFGTTRGLITLEDILEEIVGEIDDEFDDNESQIEIIDEKTILVQGRTDIEDVEDKIGITFPDGPYESIGGLLIHHFGKIPKQGTRVEIGRLGFEVKDATDRYVKSIMITVLDKDEE